MSTVNDIRVGLLGLGTVGAGVVKVLQTRAALLHRSGQHAGAAACLKEAMKLSPDAQGGAVEWAWLALVHAATDRAAAVEARRWLERAKAAMPRRDGVGLWDAVLIEGLLAEVRCSLSRFDEV